MLCARERERERKRKRARERESNAYTEITSFEFVLYV
jgi:hypothetical protein